MFADDEDETKALVEDLAAAAGLGTSPPVNAAAATSSAFAELGRLMAAHPRLRTAHGTLAAYYDNGEALPPVTHTAEATMKNIRAGAQLQSCRLELRLFKRATMLQLDSSHSFRFAEGKKDTELKLAGVRAALDCAEEAFDEEPTEENFNRYVSLFASLAMMSRGASVASEKECCGARTGHLATCAHYVPRKGKECCGAHFVPTKKRTCCDSSRGPHKATCVNFTADKQRTCCDSTRGPHKRKCANRKRRRSSSM